METRPPTIGRVAIAVGFAISCPFGILISEIERRCGRGAGFPNARMEKRGVALAKLAER